MILLLITHYSSLITVFFWPLAPFFSHDTRNEFILASSSIFVLYYILLLLLDSFIICEIRFTRYEIRIYFCFIFISISPLVKPFREDKSPVIVFFTILAIKEFIETTFPFTFTKVEGSKEGQSSEVLFPLTIS